MEGNVHRGAEVHWQCAKGELARPLYKDTSHLPVSKDKDASLQQVKGGIPGMKVLWHASGKKGKTLKTSSCLCFLLKRYHPQTPSPMTLQKLIYQGLLADSKLQMNPLLPYCFPRPSPRLQAPPTHGLCSPGFLGLACVSVHNDHSALYTWVFCPIVHVPTFYSSVSGIRGMETSSLHLLYLAQFLAHNHLA